MHITVQDSRLLFERMNIPFRTQSGLFKAALVLSGTTGFVILIMVLHKQQNAMSMDFGTLNSQFSGDAVTYSIATSIPSDRFWPSTSLVSHDLDIILENEINASVQQQGNEIKIILYWNNWDPHMGHQPLIDALCPVTSCIFTPERALLNYSDVVLFSFDNDSVASINPLPSYRQRHQRFVFVASQPPDHVPNFFTNNNSDNLLDFFNWTMTYRLDSDVVFRQTLGAYKPVMVPYATFTRHKNKAFSERSSPYLMTKSSKSLQIVKRLGDKKKLIAWFPSKCTTTVGREEYVRQLSQHIPVEIYGECGNLTCNIDCFDMLRLEYKFYLAFEESWCPDYVTKEFYKALDSDTVPVVLGEVDYDTLGPPHSFINALDFPSIQSLADYLLFLDKTPEMYAKYFNWKNKFEISLSPLSGWCDLCRFAHDPDLPTKTYRDIRKWWMDDVQCQKKLHY